MAESGDDALPVARQEDSTHTSWRRAASSSPLFVGKNTAYVAGCLFRVVEVCALALNGHAGHWLINEKGGVASAGRLPEAPANFAERGHQILAHLGTTPGELSSAIALAANLVADTIDACKPSR